MGKIVLNSPYHINTKKKNEIETRKNPSRTEIINFALSLLDRKTCYLEIGVRNPNGNFNHIKADAKYSVDPGVEFKKNPVDFKLTSDSFFKKVKNNEILSNKIKFDVIFIDGLHLAEQVDKDIQNSMEYIKDDGFIILHDCNPPTEWHSRIEYNYHGTPAHAFWNGTTWKAFLKWRFTPNMQSCCIDSDWGVGILSKTWQIGQSINKRNQFYEFNEFDANRKESLNLLSFNDFKKLFEMN